MTGQPTRTNLRTKVRSFATFIDGVLDCAAASDAGRKPTRSALKRAGISTSAFYPGDRD